MGREGRVELVFGLFLMGFLFGGVGEAGIDFGKFRFIGIRVIVGLIRT